MIILYVKGDDILLSNIVILIITIATIIYIIYNILFNKIFINVFLAIIVQSILLFIIRYFWQDKRFWDAFIQSFDFISIVIVIIYGIFKIRK